MDRLSLLCQKNACMRRFLSRSDMGASAVEVGWSSCLRWIAPFTLPARAYSSSGESSMDRSFLRGILEEVRVARAQKAAGDYRRQRGDPQQQQPASSDPNRSSSDVGAGGQTSSSSSSGAIARSQTSPALPAAAAGGASADSAAQELHPSRGRADLNAYARSPLGGGVGTSLSSGLGVPVLDDEAGSLSNWQPVTMGESGFEAMVERRIRDSVARGELDNLKLKGKPLDSVVRHDSQFYRVDPLMAAMGRSMGAQAVRPRSLELREELAAAQREFEEAVQR
ncbi:hypothetical protein Agub_g11279, partial [Astrephomene gubernaculifera]